MQRLTLCTFAVVLLAALRAEATPGAGPLARMGPLDTGLGQSRKQQSIAQRQKPFPLRTVRAGVGAAHIRTSGNGYDRYEGRAVRSTFSATGPALNLRIATVPSSFRVGGDLDVAFGRQDFVGTLRVVRVGPFVAAYPFAPWGAYLAGIAGIADSRVQGNLPSRSGLFAALGVGYEAPMDESWALGVELTAMAADGPDGFAEAGRRTVVMYAGLLTVTYH